MGEEKRGDPLAGLGGKAIAAKETRLFGSSRGERCKRRSFSGVLHRFRERNCKALQLAVIEGLAVLAIAETAVGFGVDRVAGRTN